MKIGTFHSPGLWLKIELPEEPGQEDFVVKEAFKKRPFTVLTLTPSEQRKLFQEGKIQFPSGGTVELFE